MNLTHLKGGQAPNVGVTDYPPFGGAKSIRTEALLCFGIRFDITDAHGYDTGGENHHQERDRDGTAIHGKPSWVSE